MIFNGRQREGEIDREGKRKRERIIIESGIETERKHIWSER